MVTELINNAVAHRPQRPITVALAIDGLRVVDQLTSRWGVYGGSTHVWFELPLET